jgi:hypothetical protein
MPVAAAQMAERRTHHELGAASPASIGENWFRRGLGCWRAPELMLYIVNQVRLCVVNQVRHIEILGFYNANL